MIKYTLFVTMIFFSACYSGKEQRLKHAFYLAKENASELQKVLDHYENDSLKRVAACFLIENMPAYYGYEGELLTKYLQIYKDIANDAPPATIAKTYEKWYGPFSYSSLLKKPDITNVDSAYLVNNIDWAFKVWKEQPWGKNVSFDNFCEYILPYRIKDETLTYWREKVYNQYNPLLDEIRKTPEAEDPLTVCRFLMSIIAKEQHRFTMQVPALPHAGPEINVKWKSGTCREYVDAIIYIFRALGIPCGCDRSEMQGDNNTTHFWNFFLDKNGKTFISEPYDDGVVKEAYQVKGVQSKVHRNTFSMDWEQMIDLRRNMDYLYPAFMMIDYKDVSSLYVKENSHNVTIPMDSLYHDIREFPVVYLCLSSGREWIPIDWTYPTKNNVTYNNVNGKVIFRVAGWNKGQMTFLSDPFLSDGQTDSLQFIHPTGEFSDITVYTKFHYENMSYIRTILYGVFEGSNMADFSVCDTLYCVKQVPFRKYTTAILSKSKKYRYLRYKGADGTFSEIGEIAFYESELDTIPLKGAIIGNPKNNPVIYDFENPSKAFDGNTFTYYHNMNPSGGWCGLKLNKPSSVAKIVYTPHNNDNFVKKGDEYELFYWDTNWKSAGKQIAASDTLLYKDLPQGTLYYLKNHSGGIQERIFTYENGKQLIW